MSTICQLHLQSTIGGLLWNVSVSASDCRIARLVLPREVKVELGVFCLRKSAERCHWQDALTNLELMPVFGQMPNILSYSTSACPKRGSGLGCKICIRQRCIGDACSEGSSDVKPTDTEDRRNHSQSFYAVGVTGLAKPCFRVWGTPTPQVLRETQAP